MPTEVYIQPAHDAQALAAELIPEYHPDLRRARVLILETTQSLRRRDRVKLANATKASALLRYLSSGEDGTVDRGADFIILISQEEWAYLDAAQRRALVDHELQQCYLRERVTKKGEIKQNWALRAPDVLEFRAILQRHGFWRPELRAFGHAARQLPLDAAVEPDEGDDEEPDDEPVEDGPVPAPARRGRRGVVGASA
jgi:hypothetical protein